MTPYMTSLAITPTQAAIWAAANGFYDLPSGMNWQLCEGVQWYHDDVWDACFLRAGECGLYGLIGFCERREQAS
jgi:hypothetical protein